MRLILPAALSILALVACGKGKPEAGTPATQVQPGTPIRGTVLERLDVAPYSYLRLKTEQGEVWTAVPITDLAVGAAATVVDAIPMDKWESAQLKRTFDRVYLGQLEGQAPAGAPTGATTTPAHGALGAAAGPGMGMGHPAPGPAAPVGDVKVPKAEGADARTVAEVWAQGKALSGKSVTVRGKVVRVATGLTIQGVTGKNWIHIQDGSGSAANGDHDLTVASDDVPAVGEVVTAKGKVQPNPMAGSDRAVMVHAAKVTK